MNRAFTIEERDRVGATKEEILTTTQALLKRKHGETWVSMDISWRMWANDITTKNSHAELLKELLKELLTRESTHTVATRDKS